MRLDEALWSNHGQTTVKPQLLTTGAWPRFVCEREVGEEEQRASCAHIAVLAQRMVEEAQALVASSQAPLCLSIGIAAGPVVL